MTNKKKKVLIPMAGLGSRFQKAGYTKPKPFIDVNGEKMINLVLNDVISKDCDEAILVSLTENNAKSEVLAAEDYIKNCSLILSNCDQKINFDVDDFLNSCDEVDGGLITFTSQNTHHSYVQTEDNIITNIIEKEVISNQAVAGVYYIKDANEFIKAAKSVIKFNKKEKGEFYVSSALQLLIYKGLKLISYNAESIMLGTPEELNAYLKENNE